ncbi:MAG: hypothetical protein FJ399_00225 [Verrucomicrobia bacterium]|nr:hypothetical protein [Verrucomicrobiota bacterium]
MGIFDRFTGARPEDSTAASNEATGSSPVGGVRARLAAARARLEAKDLPGAMAIYEELITAGSGDRADVLVAISGDLGMHGHVAEIIELVAPRYDADRHGPATGLNLLQAYLAVRNADAAQHVLDILFALQRPELEDRLHGFSNAIAELLATPEQVATGPGGLADAPKIGLITVSKPVWFYGLEPLTAQLLPPKEGRLRRIAFAQLAQPGHEVDAKEMRRPEDELGRLARGIPLWFAETFFFSALYAPVAAVAFRTPPAGQGENHHVVFGAEWTTENLRQLVETSGEGFDYIVTGALKAAAGDSELLLRVWEVKTFRERKVFNARWTPATADAALARIHAEVRAYMEWSPASAALAYTVPAQPRGWIDTLGAALGLFLVEKTILPVDQLAPVEEDLRQVAQRATQGEAASLAFLSLRARAVKLGLAQPLEAALVRSPLVNAARSALG